MLQHGHAGLRLHIEDNAQMHKSMRQQQDFALRVLAVV